MGQLEGNSARRRAVLDVASRHVNDRTIDYKPEGRASIRRFLKEGKEIGLIDPAFSEDSMQFIGATEE